MESHKEDILEYQEYILNPKDNIVKLQVQGPNLELTLLSQQQQQQQEPPPKFSKRMAFSVRNQTTRAIAKLRS